METVKLYNVTIKRILLIITMTLSLIVGAIGLIVIKSKYGHGIPCPYFELTHLYCPGCGATRMLVAICNGNMYQAFRYNALLFISMPAVIIVYIYQSIYYIMNGKLSNHINNVLTIYFILLVVYGVIRNTDIFSWLAPTVI